MRSPRLPKWRARSQVMPINLGEPEEGLGKIRRLDLGARHILPLVKRKLVDDVLNWREAGYPAHTDKSGQDFDIKQPPGQKGLFKQRADRGARPEQLGAALRVIDTYPHTTEAAVAN